MSNKKKAVQANPQKTTDQVQFENFELLFLKAKDSAYKEINIAHEFGLSHQEIKHSEFLSHVFDPNRKQYRLKADQSGSKAYFLRLFFAALEKYCGVDINKKTRPNSVILANGSGTGQAVTAADIEALGRAKDLQVNTERPAAATKASGGASDLQVNETPGEDDKRRIDILLISEQEQIVLVIENKVFSKTHDDQLKRYEARYQAAGWKKVFVYLTPKGDTPQNEDETEAVNWCAFDYAALRGVVEEFRNAVALKGTASITELKGKLKNKFIYALEDHMGNIDTEVLKNISVEANDVYGSLIDTYPELAAGFVKYYYGANPTAVARYCKEQLSAKACGRKDTLLYTEEMEKFFERHGEAIEKKCYIVCQGAGGYNKTAKSMELRVELFMPNASPSPAQKLIINKMRQTGNVASGNKYYSIIPNQPFLKSGDMMEPDGTYRPFDKVRPVIDKYLQDFSAKLQQLEDTLKTL